MVRRIPGRAATAGQAVVLCIALGVLLFYVNRLFTELPVYPTDEGAYLIRALFPGQLASDPERHPLVQPVANTLYFALIRLVDALSLNVIPWLRLIGALSYFGGLGLLYAAAVPPGQRRAGLGFLLIAAVFPFYRFAFVAMPDGVYAGLLCLIVFVLHRTWSGRPLLGAVLVGGLAGALVLIKPHGIVVVPAYVLAAVAGTALGRGSWKTLLGRLGLFSAGFLVVGVGIELAWGRPLERALRFFAGGAYADHLGHAMADNALPMAALSAASMVSLVAILVAVPLVACGSAALRRRAAEGTTWRISGPELTFLFATLCLAGTIAMVTVFAFKMAGVESETRRLWGRYFEFYVPMLWVLAAGPLAEWGGAVARRGRALAAGAMLAGLAGLLGVVSLGVVLNPWDGAAVTAFSAPDIVAFPFGYLGGGRLLAVLATLAITLATFAGLAVRQAWPAYFVVLGLLSTRADDAWMGQVASHWRAIEHELHVAKALTVDRGTSTVAVVDNMNQAHVAFLRLNGAASIRLAPLHGAKPFRDFDGVIEFGPSSAPGPRWRQVFQGRELAVYVREAPSP